MRVVRNDQEAGSEEALGVPSTPRRYFGMSGLARSVQVITKVLGRRIAVAISALQGVPCAGEGCSAP